MPCTRCQGLMVPDRSADVLDPCNPSLVQMWRCVICGEMVDPVIMQNRGGQDRRVSVKKLGQGLVAGSTA